jgi:hypothetical protein
MSHVLPFKRRLNVWDLRRLFNEGNYIKRLTHGEFRARSVRCNEVDLDSPMIGATIPQGSVSQTLQLFNNQNDLVVEFQRFIRPEGTIGASGYNDPKKMRINNVKFHQEQQGNPQPRLTDAEINRILGKRGLGAIMAYVKGFWYRLNTPPRQP